MRCFIAIDLPKEIKQYLSRVQSLFPKEDMNLVEENNLHLTLVFLGEIEDSKTERIKQLLQDIKINKFNAFLGKIGFFPSKDYIKVVWVSLEPSEFLNRVYLKIHENLKNEFKLDNRFESHITLARVKFLKNKEDFVKKLESSDIEKKEFLVDSFLLKKSTLTCQGPIYKDILRFEMH